MNPDWLSQLAPAHAPPPPSWWPPAPGWWALLALLVLAAVAGVSVWQARQAARPRRWALAELRALKESDAARVPLAQALESLLRRYALTVLPRERVAPLTGEAWLALLAAEGATPLGGAAGHSLLRAAYGGPGSDDRGEWLAAAEAFLTQAARRPWRLVPADVVRRLTPWRAR